VSVFVRLREHVTRVKRVKQTTIERPRVAPYADVGRPALNSCLFYLRYLLYVRYLVLVVACFTCVYLLYLPELLALLALLALPGDLAPQAELAPFRELPRLVLLPNLFCQLIELACVHLQI
jgi:hypothetical protein